MSRLMVLGIGLLLSLWTLPAAAQGQQRLHPSRPPRGMASRADSHDTHRAELERRFRERGEQIVRERLKLTNDQMHKLRDVNGRLTPRRNELFRQQRATQLAIRAELARGHAADQARVAQLMRQARELQQQRFVLQQEEQRNLSTFLTPIQQAQYFGLQAQLRRKVRELHKGQSGEDNPAP